MKLYEHRCTNCGAAQETPNPVPDFSCPRCGGQLRRTYNTFSVRSSFQPHFNHSVGQYVANQRQFDEALKVASARDSVHTGREVKLERVDPREMEPPPGALEQKEATEKVMREKGITEPTKKLIIP